MLIDQIVGNVTDAWRFGPTFPLRHLARLRGAKIATVPVPGVGPVHIRVGTSDVSSVQQVFGERDYDLGETSPVTARIRARCDAIIASGGKPVIVDAGANIGAASLWFASQYPEASIVAVEPEPGNAAILHKNLDRRPNVAVLDAALGAERGFVGIEGGKSGWGARTVRAEAGIPVVTVDDAVAAIEGGVTFIIKIDIEGFEAELFESNTGWIDNAYVVIIEPHDWMLPGKRSSRSFQRAMAAHDFEMFLSGENLIYVRT